MICKREDANVHLGSSGRNGFGIFTTPSTTTTATPCCDTSGGTLANVTGDKKPRGEIHQHILRHKEFAHFLPQAQRFLHD